MLRLMIDLETLSNQPTAAIIQVGVVGMINQSIEWEFSASIEVDDAIGIGHVNGSTLQFWSQQSHFPSMLQGEMKIARMLTDLRSLLENWRGANDSREIEQVWANPANFDLPILVHAMCMCNIPNFLPSFQTWRCLKTLRHEAERLLGVTVDRVRPVIPHIAIEDAKAQCYYLFNLENAIRFGRS
jgi:hypothetical protein